MGFLTVTVLSGLKFLPNLIKRQGYSPWFFSEMASKILLRISDISVTVLQNRVVRRLFEDMSCIASSSAEIIADQMSKKCIPLYVRLLEVGVYSDTYLHILGSGYLCTGTIYEAQTSLAPSY